MQVAKGLEYLVNDGSSFFLREEGTSISMVLNLVEQLATLTKLRHNEEPFGVLKCFFQVEQVRMVHRLE